MGIKPIRSVPGGEKIEYPQRRKHTGFEFHIYENKFLMVDFKCGRPTDKNVNSSNGLIKKT